jgi:hypothetical protein
MRIDNRIFEKWSFESTPTIFETRSRIAVRLARPLAYPHVHRTPSDDRP